MSEQQTADTDYAQQYVMHDDSEFHHVPAEPIKPVLKLSEPSPRPYPRAWPLSARLAVAVLIIALATITAISLISVRSVTAKASQASDMASQQQGTINALKSQLAAVQARVSAPVPAPKTYRPPAIYQHYGICLVRTTDNATGDLANITLVTPVVNAGSYSCPQGNLVSVVPAP